MIATMFLLIFGNTVGPTGLQNSHKPNIDGTLK